MNLYIGKKLTGCLSDTVSDGSQRPEWSPSNGGALMAACVPCLMISLLMSGAVWGQGRGTAPSISVDTIRALASQPKHEASLYERVAQIVAMGDAALPPLKALISEDEDPMPVLLTMLGFVAHESDLESIRILESIAYADREAFRREAMTALLRVGGRPAQRVIEHLEHDRNEGVREHIASVVWQLRRPADLKHARKVLTTVAEKHPDWAFSRTLRNSTLPRLDRVIPILSNPASAESLQKLRAILEKEDSAFVTVSGGMAEIWALQRMAQSGPAGAIPIIESYIAGARTTPPHLRVTALSTLARLGKPLSEGESQWLKANYRAAGSLIVTQTGDDVTRVPGP